MEINGLHNEQFHIKNQPSGKAGASESSGSSFISALKAIDIPQFMAVTDSNKKEQAEIRKSLETKKYKKEIDNIYDLIGRIDAAHRRSNNK